MYIMYTLVKESLNMTESEKQKRNDELQLKSEPSDRMEMSDNEGKMSETEN